MANAWPKAVWCLLATQYSLGLTSASLSVQDVRFQNVSFSNETTQAAEPSSRISASSASDHTTEQSTASIASQKLGDLIAQGLGMASTTASLSSELDNATSLSSSSPTLSVVTSHMLSQATGGSISSGSQQNASSSTGPSTSPPSNQTLSRGPTPNGTASPTGYIPTNEDEGDAPIWLNRSLTLSGDCWNQWSQFWSAQDWPTQRWTSHSESTVTFTTTPWPVSMWTSTYFSFYTTTVFGGRFPLTTYTTLGPVKEYEWSTGTPTTTWTATRTYDPGYTVIEGPSVSLPTPSCVLPGSISQCQQSWDSWVHWQTEGQSLATFDPFSGPPGCDPQATTTIPWSCKAPISTWEAERSSYYANDDVPRCSQAKLDEAYCSSTRSLFLWRGEKKGYYFDNAQYTTTIVEGVTTDALVWPSNTTLVGPGCTLGCGNCALQGQTVELIYWPPATALHNDTANYTATRVPDGPVTFETMGTTLTSPTVYISFDTLWAKNSCSRFGRSISNTIIAITNTQDMSSLYGYGLHMQGRQMSASFNFNDLYQDPVPDEIYESQPRCWLSSRAAQGRRYGSLPSDYPGCARTAPYEPIIVIPDEIRNLDPEWAGCRGGIEGAYDPPVALRQTNSIVVPTQPGLHTTTSPAAPASTPTSDSAPQTMHDPVPSPQPTSAPKLPDHDTAADQPPTSPADPPAKPSNTAKENGNNVWPLPVTDVDDDPVTTNALSIFKPAQVSAAAAQIASQVAAEMANSHASGASADLAPSEQEDDGQAGSGGSDGTTSEHDPHDSNDRVDGGGISEESGSDSTHADGTHAAGGFTDPGSDVVNAHTDPNQGGGGNSGNGGSGNTHADGTHATEDTDDPGSHAANALSDPKQGAVTWTHDGKAFTAVVGGGSAVVYGAGTATTVAAGTRQTFQGQMIGIPLDGNAIKVDDDTLELRPINGITNSNDPGQQSYMVFTASGKTFTAVMHGNSIVLQAGGTETTMAPGATGVLAGQTISVYSPASNVVNINGKPVTMQAFESGNTVGSLASSAVWTHDGHTFTAKIQGDSMIVLQGTSTTMRMTAGSRVTLGDEVISVLPTGGVLVHDGTTLTLAHPSATTNLAGAVTTLDYDGQAISAFDSGDSVVLIVGDRTITLADGAQTTFGDQVFSAAATGGAIVINGTRKLTLPATASATQSAERTSAQIKEESTGVPTGSASDSSASALSTSTSVIFTILAFLGIIWM